MRLLTSHVTLEPKGERWIRLIKKQRHTSMLTDAVQMFKSYGCNKTREQMWTVLFLICVWRSRHSERLNASIKTPNKRNLDSNVGESSLSFRLFINYLFSKIKISSNLWITSCMWYVYFSKFRLFLLLSNEFCDAYGIGNVDIKKWAASTASLNYSTQSFQT